MEYPSGSNRPNPISTAKVTIHSMRLDGYLKYTLLFLLMALAGRFSGWGVSILLTAYGWLATLALLAFGWQLRFFGLKPLTLPLLMYWALTLIMTTANASSDGVGRVYLLIMLIAIYHLPLNPDRFRQGARLAGWIIFPLVVLSPWDNANVLAISVWSLFFLGAGRPLIASVWSTRLFAVLAALALISTGSEGAILAVMAGGLAWLWYRYKQQQMLWIMSVAGLIILIWVLTVVSKSGNQGSFGNRMEIYQAVLHGFSLIGRGAGTFEIIVSSGTRVTQEHNLILTMLWDTGLPGLAVFGWLLYQIWQQPRPAWAGIWLITFLSHSMVDGPLFINLLSATSLMVVLGSNASENYD